MSCHDCAFSTEDECNPNNSVCKCTELLDGKPNEHYLHVLHANHNCIQYKHWIKDEGEENDNSTNTEKLET